MQKLKKSPIRISLSGFVLAVLLGSSLISLSSCKSGGLKKEGKYAYTYETKLKDGTDAEQKATFNVGKNVVDSLKISEKQIGDMVEIAVIQAKLKLKNPRTFKFTTMPGTVMYMPASSTGGARCVVAISGAASNSFGVEGDINEYIDFTTDGHYIPTKD